MTHQWLVSRNHDIAFLIAPALLGYAFLAAVAMGAPVRPFWLVMLLALDGPHAFATVTRTYLSADGRVKLGWRLWMIVPFLAVPVVMIGAGYTSAFLFIAFTWLHWHVAKRRIGIIALWKRKAGESFWPHEAPILKVLLLAPLACYWLTRWGTQRGGEALDFSLALSAGVAVTCAILALAYILVEVARARRAPEHNLLALIVPLQWLAFWMCLSLENGIIAAGIAVGVGHAIQYQFLTWTYLDGEKRTSAPWSLRLAKYAALVLGLNLLLNVAPRIAGLTAMTFGWSFMHFWLDGRIWRTKDYPVLKTVLRLP